MARKSNRIDEWFGRTQIIIVGVFIALGVSISAAFYFDQDDSAAKAATEITLGLLISLTGVVVGSALDMHKTSTRLGELAFDHDRRLKGLMEDPESSKSHRYWRELILRDAAKKLTAGTLFLPNGEGAERIKLLADFIRRAEKSVLAYSTANIQYTLAFWGEEHAIPEYIKAHADVIATHPREFRLERVFVIEDEILTNETQAIEAFRLLQRSIQQLWEVGMTCIYVTTRERAEKLFADAKWDPKPQFPEKSFFLTSERIYSEAREDGAGGSSGNIMLLSENQAEEKTRQFDLLHGKLRPLSSNHVADLWLYLETIGKKRPFLP